MSIFKGFWEWFCGKEETATSAQFSKMMKKETAKSGALDIDEGKKRE